VFFGVAQRFLDELTAVADVRVVILRLSGVQHLDATGARALRDIATDLAHRQITVLLKGAGPRHLNVLREVGVVRLVGEGHVFDELPAAVAHAREHLATRDAAPRCQLPAPG
jgi:SulP family sulfate permease